MSEGIKHILAVQPLTTNPKVFFEINQQIYDWYLQNYKEAGYIINSHYDESIFKESKPGLYRFVRDVQKLSQADLVIFSPKWETSDYCASIHAAAKHFGIPIETPLYL